MQDPATAERLSPPTIEHWSRRDAALASQVRLRPGRPRQGAVPCNCGGAWRYPLVELAEGAIWRCLHCGTLHYRQVSLPEA